MNKSLHQEAADYFMMDILDRNVGGSSNRAAFEAMAKVPASTDVAGPGDQSIAADLLVKGVTDGFVNTLNFLMMVRPSFNSEAAHTLFAVELVKNLSRQLEVFGEALLPACSTRVADVVSRLPEEEQAAVMRRAVERISNTIRESAAQAGEPN